MVLYVLYLFYVTYDIIMKHDMIRFETDVFLSVMFYIPYQWWFTPHKHKHTKH